MESWLKADRRGGENGGCGRGWRGRWLATGGKMQDGKTEEGKMDGWENRWVDR